MLNFPVRCTGYRLVYIKPEDIAISLPCGIYGNVFRSTHVILLGQITPRDRILLVKYEIPYDNLKLLMNYINKNLNVSINLTN